MKRRKNNRFKFILLLVIALGVVGYAVLRTTLTINGQTTIAKNNWDVKFTTITPVQNDGTITSEPVVTGDTTFSFGVKLNTPGDVYKVKVKVVNNGSIDAMLSANATLSGLEDMTDYVEYSATYKDGIAVEAGNLLAKNSEDEILVTIKFKDDIDAEDLADLASADVTRTLTFSMTYVQADSTASERTKVITYITRQNEGQITPGDVIGIGETEDFYVVSSDSIKTVLLAKYNLLVGYARHFIDAYSWTDDEILVNTPGYGMQSIDAFGGYSGARTSNGIVAFSSTAYWDDGEGNLLSPYNANGASYSGNPYPYVYDSNSAIYQYINGQDGYVSKLIEMGAPNTITGRLLSYEEAVATQNVEYNNKSIILSGPDYWLGSSSCWLGSSSKYDSVGMVVPDFQEITFASDYDIANNYGVRPVIEIPTSELQ